MTDESILQHVLVALDTWDISYMVTGSFASNVHGIPRATQDADVVIEATKDKLVLNDQEWATRNDSTTTQSTSHEFKEQTLTGTI